jgi:3-oxoadipate enol-lactonase
MTLRRTHDEVPPRTRLALLHPLGGDRAFWAAHLPLLPDSALAIDLPGHGRSSVPCSDSIAGIADSVLADLVAATSQVAEARWILAGVSIGGLIAQDLARRHPDRVAGLVLIDTVDRYPDEWRTTWLQRAGTARTDGISVLVEPTTRMWFSDGYVNRAESGVAYVRTTLGAMDAEQYATACQALAGAVENVDLGGIDQPTLVLCGDGDAEPFTLAAERLRRGIRGATLTWLPGGHAAAYESAPLTARLIADFAAALDTRCTTT